MAEIKRGANGKFAKGNAGSDTPSPSPDAGAPDEIDAASGSLSPETLDSLEGSGSDAVSGNGEGKRKRGRPPKQRTQEKFRSEETHTPLDLSTLNALLFSVHGLLAAVSKTPELALDEEESKRLANATAKVMELYNIEVSKKALAWSHFAMTAGSIYAPRVLAIQIRSKTEKQKRQPQPQNFAMPAA